MQEAKHEVERLQNEANAAAPANVSGVEVALAELEKEKESLQEQFATMMTRNEELKADLKPLSARGDELRKLRERVERDALEIAVRSLYRSRALRTLTCVRAEAGRGSCREEF